MILDFFLILKPTLWIIINSNDYSIKKIANIFPLLHIYESIRRNNFNFNMKRNAFSFALFCTGSYATRLVDFFSLSLFLHPSGLSLLALMYFFETHTSTHCDSILVLFRQFHIISERTRIPLLNIFIVH